MKYRDEEILLLRNNHKKKRYVNSVTGMYVGEMLVTFRKWKLFQDYSVMIPDNFTEMEPALAEKKYPSVKRPPVILTDPKGEVDITFSLYERSEKRAAPYEILEQLKVIIKSAQPASQFMGSGNGENKNYPCGWTEFKSDSLDGKVYNLMSLTHVREQSVLGMFNCPDREGIHWKPVLLEVLNTIFREEEEE